MKRSPSPRLSMETLESRYLLTSVTGAVSEDAAVIPGPPTALAAQNAIQAVPVIVADLSLLDSAAELPQSIDKAEPDCAFYVEIWVQASGNSTIVGGYVDVCFNSPAVTVTEIVNSALYSRFSDGQLVVPANSDDACRVENLGGCLNLGASPTLGTDWVRLGYLALEGDAGTELTVSLSAGDDSFALGGAGEIAWGDVAFSQASLSIVKDQLELYPVVSQNETFRATADVLPVTRSYVCEWDGFCLDLWSDQYQAEYTVALEYDASLYVPDWGNSSVVSHTSAESAGPMTSVTVALQGAALESSANYYNLGRIAFTPADQREGNPAENGTAANDIVRTSDSLPGWLSVDAAIVETDVWTFTYDLDDNGLVNMNDFIEFAQRFNQSSSQSPEADAADFNGNGKVDMSDFILFAQHFNQTFALHNETELPRTDKQYATIPADPLPATAYGEVSEETAAPVSVSASPSESMGAVEPDVPLSVEPLPAACSCSAPTPKKKWYYSLPDNTRPLDAALLDMYENQK